MIVDQLSRLEKTTEEGKEIEKAKNFPNEQFLLLSSQVPWYADIVNYLLFHLSLDTSREEN